MLNDKGPNISDGLNFITCAHTLPLAKYDHSQLCKLSKTGHSACEPLIYNKHPVTCTHVGTTSQYFYLFYVLVLQSLWCNIRLVAPLGEAGLVVMPARIQEPRLMFCGVMCLSDMQGPRLEAHPTSMVAVHLRTQPALALSFL